jgi:hypothetical protein
MGHPYPTRARYKFAKTKWLTVLLADPASFPLAPLFFT